MAKDPFGLMLPKFLEGSLWVWVFFFSIYTFRRVLKKSKQNTATFM